MIKDNEDIGDNFPHFENELENIMKKHSKIKSSNKCKEAKITNKDVEEFKLNLQLIKNIKDLEKEWRII